MKTKILILTIMAVLPVIPTAAQQSTSKKATALELSFNYQKQSGSGSNQYAVWVENSEGKVVRTLFVTQFTTKGRVRGPQGPQGPQGTQVTQERRRGYTYRPTCVPTWVTNAAADTLTDAQIDAISGATPAASGVQTYSWDFKDSQGKTVPAGNYKIYLEATLYNNSILLYSGAFSTNDNAKTVELTSTLTVEDEQHKDMITQVKAELK
ncbi:MAG TPA: DUF2271 domain-containing protein [Bacteroidaceae bacterium]|nr:DUF2271 domain-containing protein [Bacteroidaceae bacterium]HOD67866.1 DUF2271 domain-containing protein [Bacteroidaceae bacterium]HPB03231.1 DUF2271 domain-containing protein [Bacteroidaceae bacterium]HQL25403.1 DUF2271 domain-containing protein [Bacteroidaceae bacterium]